MLINLLNRSFLNRKKTFVLMIASVSGGAAIVSSLISISFEINGKISKELRAFGANILVEPWGSRAAAIRFLFLTLSMKDS